MRITTVVSRPMNEIKHSGWIMEQKPIEMVPSTISTTRYGISISFFKSQYATRYPGIEKTCNASQEVIPSTTSLFLMPKIIDIANNDNIDERIQIPQIIFLFQRLTLISG